ncbi:methyltransferase domain-containing protein [Melioribacter sp. OK-6-Me]|uniref:methyltransferase domain-containing protein n=1 Tax=unclassified Melioribacter TaxID=2627329 RepID=UPI003ED9AA8F
MYTQKNTYAAHYVLYTYDFFLEESIESVYPYVDEILIARTLKPWYGEAVDLKETEKVIQKVKEKFGDKISIYSDIFPDEQTQRNFLLTISKSKGHCGAFIVDCDEIFLPGSFEKIINFIKEHNPLALRIPYLTFIKDASFCVSPPYETNLFYVKPTLEAAFTFARKINLQETTMPYDNPEIIHFSYVRETDEQIWTKVNSFMHANDIDWDKWYREIYLKFNPYIKNFHPVYPETWRGLQLFDVNKFGKKLVSKLRSYGKLFYYDKIYSSDMIKLHLGCGDKILDDYINIDLYNNNAELKLDITNLDYFKDDSVDEIFMNAVFEHLYTFEQIPALKEWRRILKPGGKLIINSIPDFDIVVDAYVNKKPGNVSEVFNLYEVSRYTHGEYNSGNKLGQIHKDIFTKEKIIQLLKDTGFDVISIKNVNWEDEPIPCNINVIATPIKPEKNKNQGWYNEKNFNDKLPFNNRSLLWEAEKLINQRKLEDAEKILSRILSDESCNQDALNDLAYIKILRRDYLEALDNIISVLLINPNNEIAWNNISYLIDYKFLEKDYVAERLRKNFKIPLSFTKINNYQEFINYEHRTRLEFKKRERLEREIIDSNAEEFTYNGFCIVCDDIMPFKVDYWKAYNINGERVPNWRERLICPNCNLNNRMRLTYHIIKEIFPNFKEISVYATEQTTILFRLLQQKNPQIIGSEFLGSEVPPGHINHNGIRNEDFTSLSFRDEQFDLIISLEVLEHIPNYKKAIRESYRVLKKNGKFFFTVPFDRNEKKNLIRAVINQDGSINHILPPEYHGDPLGRTDGCLCYYHFGWELLDELKAAGYKTSYALFTYSKEYGYLGGEQIFFIAEKGDE